jgi:hypothetical protein
VTVRRTVAALFVLLAAVLPAVAVATSLAHREATDTERFMETAGPLATDATVQRAVADELVAAADARLATLPQPVPGSREAVRARIRSIADAVVASEAYRASWRATQRDAHERLAARLTGASDAPLRLGLRRIAALLRARVADAGLPEVAAAIPDPQPVTLADRAEVRRAREATDAVRVARAIAIPGAVLALLGVLVTAPGLASGLRRAAACLAASALLLAAAWLVARGLVSARSSSSDLALAVYDVLTRPLRAWVIGGAVGAVALAAGAVAAAAARRPRALGDPGRA